MQTTLIPKINSIINQVYECLVQVQSEKTQNMLKKIGQQIKNFMKEEQSTILKDIAKKTKQLFVLSSDNESLREKLQHLDNNIKRLNEKVAQKQKSIIKLMNDKEREKREIQEKCNEALDVAKKQIAHLEVKIFQNEARFKGQMSDLRRIHKEEMAQNIARQQQIAQSNLERLRLDFAEQKRSMIQAQNKERSELIKKYQIKLQDLRDKNEQQVYKLTNQHKQRQQKDRKIKADLNNGLFTSENTIKRLQGQLSRQSMCHQKFKSLSQSLTSQLQALHNQHTKAVSELNKKIEASSSQYQKTQKKLKQQYRQLQQLFQTTIKQKDLLFEETVSTMQNQHHDILESTKSHLLEEKQIAINQTQTKHYTEMQKLNMQHFRLENQFKQLKDSYKTVQKKYQDKIVKLVEDYEGSILSISSRKDYQLGLEGQTAKKNLEVIQRKYKLQIRSLKKQYEDLKQQLTKKISDQRISTTNKLTTHYQSIINQIKISNDVAMKQKLIEFEKKSKAYEKKLSEAQKRRVDLKIQMDRMKLDMQMKIDSLSQLNEKFQLEIQELHHHIVKMEKQRTSIVNEYDFKLLVKKNQLQQVKDQYEIKEKQLRNVFNEHIRVKNAEIQRFSQRVSEKIEQLVKKNARTVELIQKQYNQLKNIVGQRTSLPQDVEALKIFYKGYQKLQEELEKQRQIKNNIQRQLHSKCAIEKVFVAKSFTQRIQQPNPIKILTTRQFHKKDDKLIKFKSQNF